MTGYIGMLNSSPEPATETDLFLAGMERAFGPPVPRRECGACTACCTVPTIEPLGKPADTLCSHCTSGGCSIYESRPVPCRTFFCGWRRIKALPDNLRPDRCGFVLMTEYNPNAANPFDRICLVARWIDTQPDLQAAAVQRLLKILRPVMIPLFVSAPGTQRKSLVHPAPAIYQAIVNGILPDPKLAAKVKAWHTALLDTPN